METSLEYILLNFYKDEMVSFMETHPEAFEEAIILAMENRQPFSWRAAWLLWSCMKENDKRIQKHIKNIIKSLKGKNDGHERELLKILLQMKLKDEQEGFLFDRCVTIWEDINKTPSVRVTAFKIIVKIAKKHPDLSQEILCLMQNRYLQSLSPGVKKSVSKMIKEFTGKESAEEFSEE